jgi:vacuolar protein sorting-associated protein 13D
MAAPLMFSFIDAHSETSSTQVTMRLGHGLHSDGSPQWCRSFPLIPGSRVRKLFVMPKDSSRVGRIYIIGIDVRVGNGRYRDTLIITLSPRFQVHNQTSFKVQFSQRCFATTFHDMEAEATHLQAYPQSCLAFHWPRLDRDQLLCMRLMDPITEEWTLWSGGVVIDRVDSFHVALRDKLGRSIFVRIEVSLIAATYCTVLTDATNIPPPFRIDNFSEVPITCHQVGVVDENLKTVVKAHQSVPFAWDEPTFHPHITCSAPGGSASSYNMNVIGEGSQLTYENFIYVVMSATLNPEDGSPPLVFDVEGTRVFLGKITTILGEPISPI